MRLFAFIFALTAFSIQSFAADIPGHDKDFTCLTPGKAQQYVKDFSIDVNSFGGQELCDSKVDTKKLFNDLQILEDGKFNTQGSNKLIRGFVPADQYYSWMKSQTRGVQRGNDVPWATAYNQWGYFTMQDGWAQMSTLGRVGTIVHEARHTAGYSHMPCTFGPYADTRLDGCDRNYEQAGSHGVEMEYYARVSVLGQNFHPVYQAMARLMAMGRSNFVFNTSPIQKHEALLLQTKTEGLQLMDGQKVLNRDLQIEQGALKRTSFGASYFDGIKASALELYQADFGHETLKDDYSYFKLLGDDRGQGNVPLVDVEEVDLGKLRHFVYLNQNGDMGSYKFSEGKFNAPEKAPQGSVAFVTTLEDGTQGLFIRTESGSIYSLDPKNMKNTKAVNQTWPQGMKAFAGLNGQQYALSEDGQVLWRSQSNAAWAPSNLPDSEQMVNVPLYDAFVVK